MDSKRTSSNQISRIVIKSKEDMERERRGEDRSRKTD